MGRITAAMTPPTEYSLMQNHPNPFNPTTQISFAIPAGVGPTTDHWPRVTLTIYNILGQEVKVLVDEVKEPGYYSVNWDGRDAVGSDVASGVYFYRLDAGTFRSTKRMMLMK